MSVPPLHQPSRPAQRISIRIEITREIHMSDCPDLLTCFTPDTKITYFSKEKQLWTLKAGETAICLSFTAISDIPRAATRDTEQPPLLETQTHNVLKFKFLPRSGGEERLCQEVSAWTWLIIKPIRASSALVEHNAAAAAPGKAGNRPRSCR